MRDVRRVYRVNSDDISILEFQRMTVLLHETSEVGTSYTWDGNSVLLWIAGIVCTTMR